MKASRHITIILWSVCLAHFAGFGQSRLVDSLKYALKTVSSDTGKIKLLLQLSEASEGDDIRAFAEPVIQMASEKLKSSASSETLRKFYLKQLAGGYDNVGRHFLQTGEFEKAVDYYSLAANSLREGNFKMELAVTLRNIAVCFDNQRDVKKSLEYYAKALKVFEEMNDKKEYALTLNYMGGVYHNQDDIPKALEYYQKALTIYNEVNYSEGIAYLSNDLAYIHQNNGDIEKAVEYYLRALKIYGQINNQKGMANGLCYLAEIYYMQNDYEKSLQYYNKSLAISQKMGFKSGIAHVKANMGAVYHSMGDTARALSFYKSALKINEETNSADGVPSTLKKMGTIYYQQGNFSEAAACYNAALTGFTKINARHGISGTLTDLALMHYKSGNTTKALEHAVKSLKVARELGYPIVIKEPAKLLKEIYLAQKNPAKAYEMYDLYIRMSDSINNEATKKASIKSHLKYEYEKKAAADSLKMAEERSLAGLKLREEKVQATALVAGLSLTVVFAGFMFNRFRLARKRKKIIEQQKNVVEQQKTLIEEKQKEILDSIRYAKRIQHSLLPTEKYIHERIKSLCRG